jgi:hypothetical protein
MTTQIVQKKHVHLNTFMKNQGRATALPCPTGSFAPAALVTANACKKMALSLGKEICERIVCNSVEVLPLFSSWYLRLSCP